MGLHSTDKLGIERLLFAARAAASAGKQLRGAFHPEKTRRQALQVSAACAPAPECRIRVRRALHDVNKKDSLAGFGGRRRAPQGDDHIGSQIGGKAPEQGVGQVVQAAQAQQLFRFEPLDAPRPATQEVGRKPAGFGDRRQHQRIGPQQKAGEQASLRAVASSVAPVHAAQHGWGELGHCSKADQTNAYQRIGFASQMEIAVAQQQHKCDRAAPDPQQQAGQVTGRMVADAAGAQQQRHDQIITDHAGDCDRFHHDHAGGGGQTADESQQGEPDLPVGQRYRKNEGLRVRLAGTGQQHPTESDGEDEHIDQQQVGREHPCGAAQMALIDVFHHHDLELARQENHRQHRQQSEREPLTPGKCRRPPATGQLRQRRNLRGTFEDVAHAVEQAVAHVQSDGQKCHQLDERLEGDRRDHAFMALQRVQTPCAEHGGKAGQSKGEVKRAVVPPARRRQMRGTARVGQHPEPNRDSLELQCDVGNDANHGDDRDHAGEHRALSVPAADEVGDRRDAVAFGDAHHLAHDQPCQHHRQGGPEIDWQKPDARAGGTADAAEIGPGTAVDRYRQGVDPGVADHGAALRRATVTPGGNGEQ